MTPEDVARIRGPISETDRRVGPGPEWDEEAERPWAWVAAFAALIVGVLVGVVLGVAYAVAGWLA
jgi:hypothetical protein